MTNEQPDSLPSAKPIFAHSLDWAAILSATVAISMVGLAAYAIWLLQPKPAPQGRPIGEAARVQAYAIPAKPVGEDFAIWRHNRQISGLEAARSGSFQRIELSSNSINVAGSYEQDLVIYGWTGGAHCCFTRFVYDGRSGRRLGLFDLGNAEGSAFVKLEGQSAPPAAMLALDDVTAYEFGDFANSPMGTLIISWDGQKFSLNRQLMHAPLPDSPPSYIISQPALADLSEFEQSGQAAPSKPDVVVSETASTSTIRGDRAKTYDRIFRNLKAKMEADTIVAGDTASYVATAEFLNEQIYKGQAVAGVAAISTAHAKDRLGCNAAVTFYFTILRKSRWFADLDALNGNALSQISTNASPCGAVKTPSLPQHP